MRNAKALAGAVALAVMAPLILGGCQSMMKSAAIGLVKALDEEPFAIPVDGGQLKPLEAPVQNKPDIVVASAPTIAAPPERTDVVGQGDGSMKVDRVVVTGTGKKIEHKAPDFSREQIAQVVCRNQRSDEKYLAKTRIAYDATVKAWDLRKAVQADPQKIREADKAELARQKAVNDIMRNGFLFSMFGGKLKMNDLPIANIGPLKLENVDLYTFAEAGKDVMAVSGQVRNTADKPVQVPPLTLQAIDQWEFILAGESSLLLFETLAPGEVQSFEVRFLNPPDTTDQVYAHFAPPFEFRARRLCDGYDPAAFDASMLTPEDVAPGTGPIHTAAELNALMRRYQAEAVQAWPCRDGKDSVLDDNRGFKVGVNGSGERREGGYISLNLGGPPDPAKVCEPWARRVSWRQLFQMGEAADEAWGAAIGVENARTKAQAGRGSAEEVEAALAKQVSADARLFEMAQASLDRAGKPAPGVTVEVTKAVFAHEKAEGRWLDYAAKVTNTSSEPREVTALMLAVVDRLEFPYSSIRLDKPMKLAPGQTIEIKDKLPMQEPVRRGRDQPLAWKVRIGAIGS